MHFDVISRAFFARQVKSIVSLLGLAKTPFEELLCGVELVIFNIFLHLYIITRA